MLIARLFAVVSLLPVICFASYAPPDRANVAPPPAVYVKPPTSVPAAPRAIPDPRGPLSREAIDAMVLSSPLRATLLRGMPTPTATAANEKEPASAELLPRNQRRYRAAVATAVVANTIGVTNDATQESEPTVISMQKGGTFTTEHTAIVENRFVSFGRPKLTSFHTTATPPTSATDFGSPVDLPIPTGYAYAADPYLAENPYSTGVAPGRIYCSGVLYNDNSFGNASAIAVWSSDDGGATWNSPWIVATAAGNGHALDKPMIAVSYYSGTRGTVYVTWVNVNSNNTAQNTINIRKSVVANGVLSFVDFNDAQTPSNPGVPLATAFAHYPTVVTDTAWSTVYVIWRNFGSGAANDIRSASSQNWTSTSTVANNNLLPQNTAIFGGPVVNSMPMARFNAAARAISVVYAAYGLDGSGNVTTTTDIFYTYGATTWVTPVRVNGDPLDPTDPNAARPDQFLPALDCTSTGNVIVAYYDRREDSANLNYREYYTYMTYAGASLQSDFASSVAAMAVASGGGTGLGDYQDIWDDNYYLEGERASSAWMSNSGTGTTAVRDLQFSRVTY
jgi:hypothetical protein